MQEKVDMERIKKYIPKVVLFDTILYIVMLKKKILKSALITVFVSFFVVAQEKFLCYNLRGENKDLYKFMIG